MEKNMILFSLSYIRIYVYMFFKSSHIISYFFMNENPISRSFSPKNATSYTENHVSHCLGCMCFLFVILKSPVEFPFCMLSICARVKRRDEEMFL